MSGIKYTKEQDKVIAHMYKAGYSLKSIADELGRTTESVNSRVKLMRKQGKLPERWWK